jgi:hypothetical protein
LRDLAGLKCSKAGINVRRCVNAVHICSPAQLLYRHQVTRTACFFAAVSLSVLTAARTAEAAPCVAATMECAHVEGGTGRSVVYRTYAFDRRNEPITRALIMVHGAGRDADNYFRTALAAAFLAHALDDTLLVAPRFASREQGYQDTLDVHGRVGAAAAVSEIITSTLGLTSRRTATPREGR